MQYIRKIYGEETEWQLIKLIFSAAVLLHVVSWGPALSLLFKMNADGVLPTSNTQVLILYTFLIISLVHFALAKKSAGGLFAWIIFAFFLLRNPYLQYGGVHLLTILFFLLTIFETAYLLQPRSLGKDRDIVFFKFLIRWQLILVYFGTLSSKLSSTVWLQGDALSNILTSRNFAVWNLCPLLAWPGLLKVLTISVLLWEAAILILLFTPRYKLGAYFAMALHLSIGLFLNVHAFSAVVICGCLSLLILKNSYTSTNQCPR